MTPDNAQVAELNRTWGNRVQYEAVTKTSKDYILDPDTNRYVPAWVTTEKR